MKKILTIVFASAFALTLAAPIASACPNSDGKVAKEKKESGDDQQQVAKDKVKKQEKAKAKKKAVKVSQN